MVEMREKRGNEGGGNGEGDSGEGCGMRRGEGSSKRE